MRMGLVSGKQERKGETVTMKMAIAKLSELQEIGKWSVLQSLGRVRVVYEEKGGRLQLADESLVHTGEATPAQLLEEGWKVVRHARPFPADMVQGRTSKYDEENITALLRALFLGEGEKDAAEKDLAEIHGLDIGALRRSAEQYIKGLAVVCASGGYKGGA